MKRLQKERVKSCHNYNNNGEIILNTYFEFTAKKFQVRFQCFQI